MPNGNTARLPETASSLTVVEADEPGPPFDERFGGVQGWIDAIVSALVDVSTQRVAELQAGRLSDQTRLLGGDLLGRLYMIQSKIGAREFAATMRHAPGLDAAAVDRVIGAVDEIAAAVRATN